MEDRTDKSEETGHTNDCEDCGLGFRSPQGLAGHRRLVHSTSTRRELDERSQALGAKEAEISQRARAARELEAALAQRQREIDETGPSTIGLVECEDCGAWFEDSDTLHDHSRTVHPIDGAVASEAGVSRDRVNDVWTEACRKSERHPNETPEEIIGRFWDGEDQEILRKLRQHNAAFHFSKKGD
jgi:hypothetical protein